MDIPRAEYPRPQFERSEWTNLNGEWEFCIDRGASGRDRKLYLDENAGCFDKKIVVPFCPESELSGIGCKDFMACVWYRRVVDLSPEPGRRVMLNIGAADWHTFVYVNEKQAGEHIGGYVSFSVDITDYLVDGRNAIVICCEDDVRDWRQPSGKQSREYYSHGCDYTRTTGIWQTVWLENVPEDRIDRVRVYPNPLDASVDVEFSLIGCGALSAKASYEGREMGSASLGGARGVVRLHIPLSETHLWEPGHGRLYDLELSFGPDRVKSYFGLRSVAIDGMKVLINGRSVFQRLVLDQGFYPDGIYTAPDDGELKGDILRSLDCGFNGARLHEKVFEERFLFHADKMGYIVWGEYPNWGLDHSDPGAANTMLPEWLEEIARDFNHPSIVGWCPFNETWDVDGRKQCDDVLRVIYLATKAADPTRPCIDVSGGYHVVTDIYDVHDYDQDPEVFRSHYEPFASGGEFFDRLRPRQRYTPGLPLFVSEYGGIFHGGADGWGYGSAPKDEEEYFARLKGLTDALLDNPNISGFCYTQLTDVEQEHNGCYYYDRRPKFDCSKFRAINERKAKIEE